MRVFTMTTWRCQRLILSLLVVAIASFGCSKSKEPEETREGRLSRANDYFSSEQYSKAEKEYREVLRLTPDDAVAQRQLGIIYFDQGQLLQAYPLLKKSAELDPSNSELQLRLGQAHLILREFRQARDAALRVLEKQPGDEQALM